MSSGFVRNAFELSWVTLMPGLDLEATLNEEPDRKTLPVQWATVDYASFGENRVSLGETACRRESGVITVVVFVKCGTGDTNAVTLADSVRDAYRDWKDPSGKVSMIEVSPGETGEASNGRWFAASVNLVYNFDNYI